MGPWGSSVVPLAGIQLWNRVVPPVPGQLLAWSLLPVPGRPVSASPAHRGPRHKHPRGRKGWAPALPLLRCRDWGYPWHPSPASSPSRTGSLGSLRVPISPSHLKRSGAGCCQQRAASSPLNGSFLARLRQQRALCGREGPGGRALASSPLGPCQPPARPRCAPAPHPHGGEGGLARERGIPGNGIWGGGRARAAVKGARLDVPRWQWGALPWGQEPSPHGLSRISPPPFHLGATARQGDAAPGQGARRLGCRFSSGDAKWPVDTWGIPQSHRKSTGKEGWVFQEVHVSPLPVTPLQSCTPSRGAAGSRCSRLLDLDKNLFGFLQGCSVSPAEGQEESLSTGAGAVLGGGARAPQGAQTRAVLTALGAASQFHPAPLP